MSFINVVEHPPKLSSSITITMWPAKHSHVLFKFLHVYRFEIQLKIKPIVFLIFNSQRSNITSVTKTTTKLQTFLMSLLFGAAHNALNITFV
jgi:hypothetical protein